MRAQSDDSGPPAAGTFSVAEFADEVSVAHDNHNIGTTLWFENDRVRIFETRLKPGQRGVFHVHDRTYFWTVVDAGRGLQRSSDGTWAERYYQLGETRYIVASVEARLIHDLENVGKSLLRFVTVEFVPSVSAD